MLFRIAVSCVVLLAAASVAEAARLPSIKVSTQNAVPACVTPGRLMAMVKDRNTQLLPRFEKIAAYYKRHGETLGLRWDYAFFQMIVETASLKFRRPNGRPSDVRPSQNNFAGLGATARGVSGESFKSISDGVRAHLEHLLIYAGEKVENPVAERTRKVQSWGILKKWQKKIGRTITFRHLARKWAPGSRGYARNIAGVGESFFDEYCKRPEPEAKTASLSPNLSSEASTGATAQSTAKIIPADAAKARDRVKSSSKASLGGATPLPSETSKTKPTATTPGPKANSISVLNSNSERPNTGTSTKAPEASPAIPKKQRPKSEKKVASAPRLPKTAANATPEKPAKKKTRNKLTAKSKSEPKSTQQAKKKCRVWTASYGGQKAVLIKSETDDFTNYTVLDVNRGKEKREAAAYIAAYAKGGRKLADFSSQTQALNKAFELCPEG